MEIRLDKIINANDGLLTRMEQEPEVGVYIYLRGGGCVGVVML